MRRRTQARIAILVEDAELPAAGQRRYPHPRHDAVAPLLERLLLVTENLHGCPFRHSGCGSSKTPEFGVGYLIDRLEKASAS